MKKIVFVALLVSILFLAACEPGFGSDRAAACASDFVDCRYYEGTRGVDIILDNPPHTLYYHSSDINRDDGNMVDFNIRVRNSGASDTYGAVFLTGFGNDFVISRADAGVVDIGTPLDGCTVSLGGVSGEGLSGFFSSFGFDCTGFGISNDPWRGAQANIDFGQLNEAYGWNLPSGLVRSVRFNLRDGIHRLNVDLNDFNIDLLYHGKLLLAFIEPLDLERFGGEVYRLRGDNPEYPGGGDDYKTIHVRMGSTWPAGTDQFNVPYQVKSCYAYTTFVSPEVCVDPSPHSGDDKVCRANRQINTGSQGAPVAVTRVDQHNTGRTVELTFHVRNVGNGRVWNVGSLERCSPYYPDSRISTAHRNVVFLAYAEMEGVALRCDRREIRLDDRGEGTFRCSYDLRDSGTAVGSAYVAPLRAELWYGYEQTINRNLRVVRAS